MKGFAAICLLLVCTSTVAFSLQRPTKVATRANRVQTHSNPTFLKAEEEGSSTVVAAAPSPAASKVQPPPPPTEQ